MKRRRRGSFPLTTLLLAAGALLAPTAVLRGVEPTAPPVSIFFETQLPYVYEDDPIPVAVTIKNISLKDVDNSKGIDLAGGLVLEDTRGNKLKIAPGLGTFVSQPKALERNAFFGRVVEMTEIFPDLKKAGNYRLTWKGTGASSNELILRVVERFNPKKDYRVRIETDFGPIVFDLLKDGAPRHVRNFIDLVRQGFYNGNQFHRVVPGQSIIGGSPTGEADAGAGYNLKPEYTALPIEAGTVYQVRNKFTAPDDSGSHFAITAIGKPELRGKVSVLGRVVEGLDTVKTICQLPTAREAKAPPGTPARPVKPVLMKKVTVIDVTGKTGEKRAAAQ